MELFKLSFHCINHIWRQALLSSHNRRLSYMCNSGVELCRFRTANHKLPIEIGRWNNTNRNNRICTHCNKNELGDEFHYILDCPCFEQVRNIYIPK